MNKLKKILFNNLEVGIVITEPKPQIDLNKLTVKINFENVLMLFKRGDRGDLIIIESEWQTIMPNVMIIEIINNCVTWRFTTYQSTRIEKMAKKSRKRNRR